MPASPRHLPRVESGVDATRWLRVPTPDDDKYTRGVLGVRTGAAQYPGAAVLGVSAAWRTGVGMVRYVPVDAAESADPSVTGLTAPAAAVLAARPETVFGEGRANAWLIGSGTDPATRGDSEREALTRLLRGQDPVVVDAGALELAAEVATGAGLAPMILTPHLGEFERLWAAARLGPLPEGWPVRRDTPGRTGHPGGGTSNTADDASTVDPGDLAVLATAAARLARELGVTVLLKGSISISVAPSGDPLLVGPATPWLATAGTGDVLAGILGALVAGNADAVRRDPALLRDLGATAAILHDTAARIAAEGQAPGGMGTSVTSGACTEDTSRPDPGRPITALDVAAAIPAAVNATIR